MPVFEVYMFINVLAIGIALVSLYMVKIGNGE